jgi:hypothetical protein
VEVGVSKGTGTDTTAAETTDTPSATAACT